MKEWVITVRQKTTVGNRKSQEGVDRYFTVFARTVRAATKSVMDSGIRGRIISVVQKTERKCKMKQAKQIRRLEKCIDELIKIHDDERGNVQTECMLAMLRDEICDRENEDENDSNDHPRR